MVCQNWGVKFAVLVLGLLTMVPETLQLNTKHPLFGVVNKINVRAGPFLGLVISGSRQEKTLVNSKYFIPDGAQPFVILAGRKFHIGKFNGTSTIWVRDGKPTANVGVTVQLLIDTFHLTGIVHYGAAATVNDEVKITDVVVPNKVVYTDNWRWEAKSPQALSFPGFKIGDYNLPAKGENSLASIQFIPVPLYTPKDPNPKNTLFIDVYPKWTQLASELKYKTSVRFNLIAGTADAYLFNQPYGAILNHQLHVSVFDTASAAVVTTATANEIPHIVFRGTSNRPGVATDEKLLQQTADNLLNAVANFISAVF